MEKKISEIKSEFALTGIDGIEGFINEYADDERPGVQALVLRAKKNLEKYNAEIKYLKHLIRIRRIWHPRDWCFSMAK